MTQYLHRVGRRPQPLEVIVDVLSKPVYHLNNLCLVVLILDLLRVVHDSVLLKLNEVMLMRPLNEPLNLQVGLDGRPLAGELVALILSHSINKEKQSVEVDAVFEADRFSPP